MGQCDCVSVYPVLLAEQHSLPRTEDIFRNLAGEKHFSKLDLRQAYHQMVVTDESKKYLTINTHKGLFGIDDDDIAFIWRIFYMEIFKCALQHFVGDFARLLFVTTALERSSHYCYRVSFPKVSK